MTNRAQKPLATTSPVPLYPVSLAFASGCALALATQCSQTLAALLFLAALLAWLFCSYSGKRNAIGSITAFYFLAAFTGLFHSAISSQLFPANHVRFVSESTRNDPQTTWLAVVIDDPQNAPSTKRMGRAHQSFTLELKAWRTGNFDAYQSTDAQPALQDSQATWHSVSGNVTCRIIQPIAPIELGDEIVITGQLQPYGPPLVPGKLIVGRS